MIFPHANLLCWNMFLLNQPLVAHTKQTAFGCWKCHSDILLARITQTLCWYSKVRLCKHFFIIYYHFSNLGFVFLEKKLKSIIIVMMTLANTISNQDSHTSLAFTFCLRLLKAERRQAGCCEWTQGRSLNLHESLSDQSSGGAPVTRRAQIWWNVYFWVSGGANENTF